MVKKTDRDIVMKVISSFRVFVDGHWYGTPEYYVGALRCWIFVLDSNTKYFW